MEDGGYRLLLRYLKDFDLSTTDPNAAPATVALLEQKLETMGYLDKWWHQCLLDGYLFSIEDAGWRELVLKSTFLASVDTYARHENVSYKINQVRIGRRFVAQLRAVESVASRHDGVMRQHYKLPALAAARAAWDETLGHPVDWPET